MAKQTKCVARSNNASMLLAAAIAGLGINAVRSRGTNGTWNAGSSGVWSNSGQWSNNVVADGAGATALLGDDLGGDVTVNLDADRTIGALQFEDTEPLVYKATGSSPAHRR